MRTLKVVFLFTLAALSFVVYPVLAQSDSGNIEDIIPVLDGLGGEPCPDSEFICVTLPMPLDHTNPENGQTINVTFAVLPAWGERKGMYVTVVGGPGASGLAAKDYYSAAMDEAILEHFDIVFFDQRGMGENGFNCYEESYAFYQAEWNIDTPEQLSGFINMVRRFVDDCRSVLKADDILPHLGTTQAIEDLEVFRQLVGDEQFWLYGESYGTQYSQMYAAAHPERLAGLILDGAIDLTLTGFEYYRQQAQAFDEVLFATLDACNADPLCAADFDGDVWAFYDDYTAELATAPISVNFPLPTGDVEPRQLTLDDFYLAINRSMYSERNRMLGLRMMAAAAHGDPLPLLREAYVQRPVDPLTLEPIRDTNSSDTMYFAVECSDYQFVKDREVEGAYAFVDASFAASEGYPDLGPVAFGHIPCVFWPSNPLTERPLPLTAEGIPTLVLGATADPATPVGNGQAIFSRLADGYLFTTQGGAHVIYGRGNECPDSAVTAFLVNDIMPKSRETICEGVVIDPYEPLTPKHVIEYSNVLDIMAAVNTELFYLPEYFNWDLEKPTTVGCPFGGMLAFSGTDIGEALLLSECAFVNGFKLTGTGIYDYNIHEFSLDVQVSGETQGDLLYRNNVGEGRISVTGQYGGQSVDLIR